MRQFKSTVLVFAVKVVWRKTDIGVRLILKIGSVLYVKILFGVEKKTRRRLVDISVDLFIDQ